MRKRNLFMAAAVALAGMFGAGSTQIAKADYATQQKQQSPEVKINKKHKIVNEVGGLSLAGSGKTPGLTPKQYGQIFGNGGSKRSNRLRYSHNAKLKRRINNA